MLNARLQNNLRFSARITVESIHHKNSMNFQFCRTHGIHRHFSVAYTPQQNGVAEKRNKDLNNSARSLLQAASLPKVYWAEGVAVAIHAQNRLPSKRTPGQTPYKLWAGRKPDLSYLKTFGCLAFAHVPDHKRNKWDAKSRKLMVIGYSDNVKGFKLIDPKTRAVTYARNVQFKEETMWMDSRGGSAPSNEILPDPEVSVYPGDM